MDNAAEEGACAQHHGLAHEANPRFGAYTANLVALDDEIAGCLLEERQVGWFSSMPRMAAL